MKILSLILILLIPLHAQSEDLKIYGAIYYGSNTITPCTGVASEIIASLSDISKLDKFKNIKESGAPIFIVFSGFKRVRSETAAYENSYRLVKLISFEGLNEGLVKCQKLLE